MNGWRRCACGLGLFVLCGAAPALAAVSDDGAPVEEAIAGALAKGTFAAVGEAITEMVRREYPGSAITYEPGTLAGSLARVLNGELALTIGDPLDLDMALRGQPPFARAYAPADFGVVYRIAEGLGAFVLARERYAEEHGIRSLADVARQRLPVRIATTVRSNLITVRQADGILTAYRMPAKTIRKWGGEVHYVPASTFIQMFADGKVDILITLGFAPRLADQVTRMASATPARLLPIARPVVDALVRAHDLETLVVPRADDPLLERDYYTTSVPVYVIAGRSASPLLTYKLAKATFRHFEFLRSLHPNFRHYRREMLVRSGRYPLHAGAAQFFREAGLIR